LCAGQLLDCLGVPGGTATVGSPCNDGNASTGNDVYGSNCVCAGQLLDCLGVPGGTATVGSPCNDGNANTGNDVYGANCDCAGQVLDCEGTPGGAALPGTGCDDSNPNTVNDIWSSACICLGDISTGIDGFQLQAWFTIFPNPSNGTFQVTPAGPITNAIEIRVFDGLGQIVGTPLLLTGSQSQCLDLQQHATGIYFLRATRGSESQVLELIIQR
jgi:hypothetical protein